MKPQEFLSSKSISTMSLNICHKRLYLRIAKLIEMQKSLNLYDRSLSGENIVTTTVIHCFD